MEFLLCNDIEEVVGCLDGHGIKIIILTTEVTGSTPVEALIVSGLPLSNCLNWKIYRNDHSSLLEQFSNDCRKKLRDCDCYPQRMAKKTPSKKCSLQ